MPFSQSDYQQGASIQDIISDTFSPELFTDLFSELCVVSTTRGRKAQQTGLQVQSRDLLVGGMLFLKHSHCPIYSLIHPSTSQNL